jgi:hypothetical protein
VSWSQGPLFAGLALCLVGIVAALFLRRGTAG